MIVVISSTFCLDQLYNAVSNIFIYIGQLLCHEIDAHKLLFLSLHFMPWSNPVEIMTVSCFYISVKTRGVTAIACLYSSPKKITPNLQNTKKKCLDNIGYVSCWNIIFILYNQKTSQCSFLLGQLGCHWFGKW